MNPSIRNAAYPAAVVAVLFLCGDAPAQTKSFKVSGAGVAAQGLPLPGQDPRPHTIVGTATHLGRHTGAGSVQTFSGELDPARGVIAGAFGSGDPFVFSGARGDTLVCNYGRTDRGAGEPGYFELTILDAGDDGSLLVEALFIAEFVPVPAECTGKFRGVTGGWVMYAWTEPFVLGSSDPIYYEWEGKGALTFPRK